MYIFCRQQRFSGCYLPLQWLLLITIILAAGCGKRVNPNHQAWADSVAEQSYNRVNAKNPAAALSYLDSVYRVTPDRGAGDRWRKYNAKVNYYSNYGFDTARRRIYIDSMFTIIKGQEQAYAFEYAHTLFAMGSFLQAQKRYTDAFKYYYDGKSFARNHLDNCSLSDFSNCLGVIRYQQGQYMNAIPYLKQGIAENSSCKAGVDFYYSFILPQSMLNTIALCFDKAGNTDSAIVYYRKALTFITNRGSMHPQKYIFVHTALGVVEGNLGGLYSKTGNFALAEKYLKDGISSNDRTDYAIEDAQLSKIKLAALYIRFGHLPQADLILNTLSHDLHTGRGKSVDNDEVRRKWYQLKWQLADKQHQLPLAYQYIQLYHALNDSLNQANSSFSHIDMDQVFKDHEQQFLLQLLNKSNEAKKAYLIAVFIFLLTAVSISLTVWYHLRRSKKNISELTTLNIQLKNTLVALENSQEDNSRMMKIVAHDLRNPIGAMTSIAATMLHDDGRTDDDRNLLEMIKISGDNSLDMVNDLLHVNTHLAQIDKEPVELKSLLRYCIDLLQHKADAKNQHISLAAGPVTIRLNREKIWRVISNLLANAIKFSPAGSPIIISLTQTNQQVRISVRDQGIGIPTELQHKIFDIFTEAKRRGTAGEESFGLGLAISKQIVEAHGGTIGFQSHPDTGTTFFVLLPVN